MCRRASPGDSQASLLRWKLRRGLGHRVGALNYEPQDESLTVIYHTRCWSSAALNVTTISCIMAFIPLKSWPNCLLETILSLSESWFITVIYDNLYMNHKPRGLPTCCEFLYVFFRHFIWQTQSQKYLFLWPGLLFCQGLFDHDVLCWFSKPNFFFSHEFSLFFFHYSQFPNNYFFIFLATIYFVLCCHLPLFISIQWRLFWSRWFICFITCVQPCGYVQTYVCSM